jgi:hypothetical protein
MASEMTGLGPVSFETEHRRRMGLARKRRRMWRKRWKKGPRPKDPQAQARQVWEAIWPLDPWPKGLKVYWVAYMRGAMGLALPSKVKPTIKLSWADFNGKNGNKRGRGVVGTLIHEFIHIRNPRLRHGKDFIRLQNQARARIGLLPRDIWRGS